MEATDMNAQRQRGTRFNITKQSLTNQVNNERTGVEALRAADYQLDDEEVQDDHSNCSHGPITAENGYEFFCEVPRGCRHQTQKTLRESRKCISNFFGRNKACAQAIVRPIIWCRSHYQMNAYNCERWNFGKLTLIWEQMCRIEEDNPGTRYCVVLKLNEAKRLENWFETAEDSVDQPGDESNDNRGRGYRSQLWALEHIQENFLGQHQTQAECKQFLDWVLDKLRLPKSDPEHLDNFPQVEFLPEFPGVFKFDKLDWAQKSGISEPADESHDIDETSSRDSEQSLGSSGQTHFQATNSKRKRAVGEEERSASQSTTMLASQTGGFTAINAPSNVNDAASPRPAHSRRTTNSMPTATTRLLNDALHHSTNLVSLLVTAQLRSPEGNAALEAALATLRAVTELTSVSTVWRNNSG